MDRVVRRHRTIPCEQGDPEVARSTYIKAEAELAGAGRVSFDPTGDTFRAGQRVKLAEAQQPAGQAAYSNILDLAVATSVMTRVRGAFGSRPLPSTPTWSQTGHSITSCSAPDARGGPQQQDRGQGQRPGHEPAAARSAAAYWATPSPKDQSSRPTSTRLTNTFLGGRRRGSAGRSGAIPAGAR